MRRREHQRVRREGCKDMRLVLFGEEDGLNERSAFMAFSHFKPNFLDFFFIQKTDPRIVTVTCSVAYSRTSS